MATNSLRDQRIIKMVEAKKWSFRLIAEHLGVSRSVVAGVAFRARHGGNPDRSIKRPRVGPGKYADYTAVNTP